MTTRSTKLAALLGLALIVAANGAAQITKSGNGYLFRMKYAKGQTAKYAMDVKASIKNPQTGKTQTMDMSMPMVSKVTAVSGGTGTIQATVGPVKALVDGKPFNLPNNQPKTQTTKMDARGN